MIASTATALAAGLVRLGRGDGVGWLSLAGLGYLLSILMRGRLRSDTAASPTYRRISAQVTTVWAVAELAVSGWEAWHLSYADAVEFVGARGLIGWPAMATVIFFCAFCARFRIEWLQGPTLSHTRATTPVTL